MEHPSEKKSNHIVEQYPEIKEAFDLKIKFRAWYKPNETKDKTWNFLNVETALLDWIYTAE